MIEARQTSSSQLTGTDDVLDLEVGELRIETELLNDPSVLP